MKKLLQLKEQYRWDLEGIEFAIAERIGEPENFIGRVEEMEYLYKWTETIQKKIGRSVAFLGRRKIGKSLILERLYNILYSEQKGLIPFYYEFMEGRRSGKEFYLDFIVRFYMQVIGYYTRDIRWIREAVDKKTKANIEAVMKNIEQLSLPHKETILNHLEYCVDMLNSESPLYEYVISATAAPHGFATTPGVEEQIVQMIDEFQYLNMYIDAGVEDKPSKCYMSTAESKLAPLLITGSLMGVVSEELMRYLPQRFDEILVPKMKDQEAVAMTLNYGTLYEQAMSPEIAQYIVHITNNVPGRIVDLLTPKIGKPEIADIEDVDGALEFEVKHGRIKKDWDDYLVLAIDSVNDINMRKMTYFLCKHEGNWYYPRDLKRAMELDIEDAQLRKELYLLHKYDIIEQDGGQYGGVFDRTLKKVLMTNYGDILELPVEEFYDYFKSDNLLDYLKERVQQLQLSLAQAREVKRKLQRLQNEHNNLKGHYYERDVLLRLIKGIIDEEGGIVAGIPVTDFQYTLNYHLETGKEVDIVLEGEHVVVVIECKNYAPENLDQITKRMVDEFLEKVDELTQKFPGKELRPGFFSKHGFEEKMEAYLERKGIRFKIGSV